MHWIFFWMLSPFDNNITDEDWTEYLDSLGWEFFLWVIASVAVICVLYAIFSRRLTWAHLNSKFWPMRFLWLAILPGIVVGIRADMLFDSFGGLSGKNGAIPAGISTGFAVAIAIMVISWCVFAFKYFRLTPPMFESRPYAWFIRSKER